MFSIFSRTVHVHLFYLVSDLVAPIMHSLHRTVENISHRRMVHHPRVVVFSVCLVPHWAISFDKCLTSNISLGWKFLTIFEKMLTLLKRVGNKIARIKVFQFYFKARSDIVKIILFSFHFVFLFAIKKKINGPRNDFENAHVFRN